MIRKHIHIFLTICLLAGVCSCASIKKFTAGYYLENERAITSIEESYKELYNRQKFSIEFTDKTFNYISLEIKTDSIKYIYEFGVDEPRLQDSLARYNMNATGVKKLIGEMQALRCTWINNLDYYVDDQKRNMVYLSIRPVTTGLPFREQKYYILAFFSQPQYFDSEGRLLANRRARRLRKINDDFFRRINDKVCYTISERFR